MLLFWLAAAALLVWARWQQIQWFALADTDDNLRIAQVRAWLAGQGWFDLRQYKLAPPGGADVHWSRLVDLPIAGIKLLLTPLLGGADAERAAVRAAPLLPLGVAFFAIAAIARRMIGAAAWPLAIALLLCAHSARGMWVPLRIDHHGWQLALLGLVLVGLTDARRARGGAVIGFATALSLVIGLEMLIYLALAGAVTILRWVHDRAEAPRAATYGASLAGGCAAGFLLFASYANRAPVCDALSPVWLSAMIAAGGAAVLLARLSPERWTARFGLAAAAGAIIAVGFVLLWPHCLGRPEGVTPELDDRWLSHVREARPVYTHSLQVGLGIVSLPVAGLIGYALMLWRSRRDAHAAIRWGVLALPALVAATLLLWQTRAGPAAQLLSIPGAAALAWAAFAKVRGWRPWPVQSAAIVAAFLVISGLAAQWSADWLRTPVSAGMKKVNRANSFCPTLAALRAVAMQPKGTVLTFVDLGPRLIAVTPHSAIAGPYHRNGDAILDVMHAFRGSADTARAIVEKRGVDYVLICPGMSESTVYRSEAKQGFYVMLAAGQVPDWLDPVDLPKGSPYRMWRVIRR
ncbi:hypothetical protein [Allosphingosinicella indica]|uniref:AcrB/AcrD/AcrF family protein n=1 Tax=Allosphingosinicella indica TaxID=941907 RepID=A0A1X7GCB8_9SPHN|nr:hypothetical protein [Allosphingosinicella indica]SMF67176.1 hypothetical protein SAMN06295910_1472 [Allosphingosinicella indica]